MTKRDNILASVRANRPSGVHLLPDLPIFPANNGGDSALLFTESLKSMGGKLFEGHISGNMSDIIRTAFPGTKTLCSATPEIAGDLDLLEDPGAELLADVDVAIVRASFGIAETGSVLFTETDLLVNAVAYLAQHLVVLLDPSDIVNSTQEAYRQAVFRNASYAVFHTGPSATADIEGVLIHGAQGVRSLTVILIPRGG
jgi:L-lactate dehydrogenase complex protein LldG